CTSSSASVSTGDSVTPSVSPSDDSSVEPSVDPSVDPSVAPSVDPEDSDYDSNSPQTPIKTYKECFEEALNTDYSNVTLLSYQSYYDGESTETDYEYIDDGYVVDFSYDLAQAGYDTEDCYSYYYVDDDGTCWTHWDADEEVSNSKGGWLNKGYKNADLSLWNAYFYLPLLLENVTADDIGYSQGLYYIKSTEKVEELKVGPFCYAYFNDLIDICFTLDENNAISKIYGFCDENRDDPVNFVEIDLMDIGSTEIPVELPDPLSEETKTTYWQYKGWEHDYQDAYYTAVNAQIAPNQDLDSDEDSDALLTLDDRFFINYSLSPSSFNPWDFVKEENKVLTWHYDETIISLETVDSLADGTRRKEVHAIGVGETEIYATIPGKDGLITSQKIKVKVGKGAQQDKTDAVYDFSFATIDSEYNVLANNLVSGAKAPYEISAAPGVDIINGKNSDLFESGKLFPVINPADQAVLKSEKDAGLYFDFGDQQVSEISFLCGLFYSNHKTNISNLKSVTLRTSNDGENWTDKDITAEIKENISADFTKLFVSTFAPASQVQLVMKANTIGSSISVGLDSLCFRKNAQCHDHVDPSDVVDVTSVSLSPSEADLYVDETVSLVGIVAPSNATDSSLTYHVEEGKEDIVSVSETGVVTALKAGSAKVYALSKDGKIKSNDVTITVTPKPTLDNYIGEYEGEYFTASIGEDNAVSITNGTVAVEGTLKSYKNDQYLISNAKGESFTLSFNSTGSDITISAINYLKDNVITVYGGTYYASKVVNMTSFGVKVGSLTIGEDEKYHVLEGSNVYLTINNIAPSNANHKDVTLSSSDTEIATVDNDTKNVVFVGSGEVTITVASDDDATVKKEIAFAVAPKVYPTEASFSLASTGDVSSIEVSATLQMIASFSNADINTSKEVTWSIKDKDAETSKVASISKTGLVTAKAAGVAVVSASVTGKDGVITKTFELTVTETEEGSLAAEVVGVWSGTDD
ncbi:MAG: Ig-like domain-containing protein, partial [Bacilli bacterium]